MVMQDLHTVHVPGMLFRHTDAQVGVTAVFYLFQPVM